jgi:DNA-binding transcriptional LysR family regulator
VRIAASEPIAAGVLPIVIGRLSQRYPRVSTYVTQTPIAMLQHRNLQYADLHERNVDLVFGPVVGRVADDGLAAEVLFDDHLLVAAGARSAHTRRRKPTLAGLIERSWCLPPLDSLVGMRCAEAFRAEGLGVPSRTVTSTSTQLQTGLVTTQDDAADLVRPFRGAALRDQSASDPAPRRATGHRHHHVAQPHDQPGGTVVHRDGA